MQTFRAFGLVLSSLAFLMIQLPALAGSSNVFSSFAASAAAQQQVVETVDIQGNRRLRDEDLLYYVKTRAGDVYDPAALERDLRELLSLNFFDKTKTRVLTS